MYLCMCYDLNMKDDTMCSQLCVLSYFKYILIQPFWCGLDVVSVSLSNNVLQVSLLLSTQESSVYSEIRDLSIERLGPFLQVTRRVC